MRFFVDYNFIVFIFFTLISVGLKSQSIWVEDNLTAEPLEGVLIFSEENGINTITDVLGKADLKTFHQIH